MPFRARFDCLWCGRAHQTQSTEDLEGWAALCPDCIGRAGENGFLRARLRAALVERGSSTTDRPGPSARPTIESTHQPTTAEVDAEMKAYYAARAPEYDDVYLHRGQASSGPVLDLWFDREIDELATWLDSVPIAGDIVELAAGTGWWSPLLADKGELSIYDVNPEPLEIARQRLVAHRLRAHIHVRDAWAEPDRQVDAVFCGFWLSHVPRWRLDDFLGLVQRWLKRSGRFLFLDERARSGPDGPDEAFDPATETSLRRLQDGREFRIPKVYYGAGQLRDGLIRAGFATADVRETERFFLMGAAQL